ncbi:flavin reductase family protein [Amycolatopsis sp.]|uniref:flavin reductase family protein n=1 Tax=Amycolatopsis sp. TaxID=37632 RepID=UPI002D7E674E|nr:flavin reductase family protein [Amycolatopsis sp.]HET6711181.1 flavin reductase family protein [Amycolatopsis sp.]
MLGRDFAAAPATRNPVEAARFRSLMATFPTGVAIATTFDTRGRPRGMTCSSVCSASLHPPTLLLCLRHGSPTLDAMLVHSTFAANLLHHRARAVAELFASGIADRFDRIHWEGDGTGSGPHLTAYAHAIADCQISRIADVGDHTVVFGEVFRVAQPLPEEPNPLLYGLRGYSSWLPGE